MQEHMFNCLYYSTVIAAIWLTFSYYIQLIAKFRVSYTDPGYNSIFSSVSIPFFQSLIYVEC